jgi:hypothetical protein
MVGLRRELGMIAVVERMLVAGDLRGNQGHHMSDGTAD